MLHENITNKTIHFLLPDDGNATLCSDYQKLDVASRKSTAPVTTDTEQNRHQARSDTPTRLTLQTNHPLFPSNPHSNNFFAYSNCNIYHRGFLHRGLADTCPWLQGLTTVYCAGRCLLTLNDSGTRIPHICTSAFLTCHYINSRISDRFCIRRAMVACFRAARPPEHR